MVQPHRFDRRGASRGTNSRLEHLPHLVRHVNAVGSKGTMGRIVRKWVRGKRPQKYNITSLKSLLLFGAMIQRKRHSLGKHHPQQPYSICITLVEPRGSRLTAGVSELAKVATRQIAPCSVTIYTRRDER